MAERLFEFLRQFLDAYGYWTLVVVLLLENAGVPAPGETTLLFVSFLAWSERELHLGYIILVGIAACTVGDNLGYAIGYRGGRPLLDRYQRFLHIPAHTIARGEHQYCWSVAISLADSKTLLLSTSKSAYGAHYKESANSIIYRRTGGDAWKPVRKGLPDPQGLRIPVVAASSSEPGVFYCSTEGMVYRSEDDGLQWQKLAVQWNSKATAEHATGMAIVEEG